MWTVCVWEMLDCDVATGFLLFVGTTFLARYEIGWVCVMSLIQNAITRFVSSLPRAGFELNGTSIKLAMSGSRVMLWSVALTARTAK